jgi:hypothetical protein
MRQRGQHLAIQLALARSTSCHPAYTRCNMEHITLLSTSKCVWIHPSWMHLRSAFCQPAYVCRNIEQMDRTLRLVITPVQSQQNTTYRSTSCASALLMQTSGILRHLLIIVYGPQQATQTLSLMNSHPSEALPALQLCSCRYLGF